MKKILLSLIFMLVAVYSWAYDVEIDRIYYTLNHEQKEARVTADQDFATSCYSGEIIIPSSITYNGMKYTVTAIDQGAFYLCKKLTFVTIPGSVQGIGRSAFYGCTSLKSVVLPNSVTYIDALAFNKCNQLRTINIPSSVTTIGVDAFAGCTALPVYENCRYADTYLINVIDKSQTEYTIKEGTKFIGSEAFSGCTNLSSIRIPGTVKIVESNAFKGCTNLPVYNNCRYADNFLVEAVEKDKKEYIIKDGTTYIGNNAFKNCDNLESIVVPNSVKRIGSSAFDGCSNMTSITLSDSLTIIDGSAFRGCM